MNPRTRVLLFVNGALLLLLVGVGVALAFIERDDVGPDTRPPAVSLPPTQPEETGVTVGIICSTPEDASESLVGAWKADVKTAAARCADQAVVDELFRTSGVGADWIFQGCGGPDPGVPQCQYSYEGGSATLTLHGTEAEGWKVVALDFVAD